MTQTSLPIDYLNPEVPPQLPWHDVSLIEATNENLAGYGYLVKDPEACEVEIVQWPEPGWRPIDSGTGDEGGIVEGIFHSEWKGEVLQGSNDAVKGNYVLGWSTNPGIADQNVLLSETKQILLWHMNYHPDGGQLFFPLDNKPFVVPAALPGDNLKLDDIIAFYCDGSQGIYIHPNIWHEGVFPRAQSQSFLDRQGRIHARVSCNISQEFGVFLRVPLDR